MRTTYPNIINVYESHKFDKIENNTNFLLNKILHHNFISDHVRKYRFRKIAENQVTGNMTRVTETNTELECARRCTQSEACDHVTMTEKSDGGVRCEMVSSGGQNGKTFSKP